MTTSENIFIIHWTYFSTVSFPVEMLLWEDSRVFSPSYWPQRDFVWIIPNPRCLVGGDWLPWILFSQKYWVFHHPNNWRTHIFQRGGYTTTKQMYFQFLLLSCFEATASISAIPPKINAAFMIRNRNWHNNNFSQNKQWGQGSGFFGNDNFKRTNIIDTDFGRDATVQSKISKTNV